LRVDAAGVVIEGERLLPVPPADQTEGVYLSNAASHTYHSAFHAVRQHGLTVVISKQLAEVLAPWHEGKSRQWVINVIVSLAIMLSVLGMLRMLQRQQAALEQLQRSQFENQQLIASLEEEHQRSS